MLFPLSLPRRDRSAAPATVSLESIGRLTIGALGYAGGVASLVAGAAGEIARLRWRLAATLDQAYLLGVSSAAIVVLTMAFTGTVFSLEFAIQATHWGAGTLVGGAFGFAMARELGPLLTAVVVAGRSGAAIAAELGAMAVTEQIEALRALGLSAVRLLVVPRLLALMLMLPLLTIVGEIVGTLAGMYSAQSIAQVSTLTFLTSLRSALPFSDVLRGLLKSVVFAVIIAGVASAHGLTAGRGAAGVGRATTGAVVAAIILVFAFNLALSYLLFASP